MRKPKRQENGVTAYGFWSNLRFFLRATASGAPKLYPAYGVLILCGVLLPLLSAYLPKSLLELLAIQAGLPRVTVTVLLYMGGIALCSAWKEYLTKYCFLHKLQMNTHYLRMLVRKGLMTSYANQEREEFRLLQSDSFSSCNGHYSEVTAVYDALSVFLTGLLGFFTYFGILLQLHPLVVIFLTASTALSYVWNLRIVRWEADQNEVRVRHRQRIGYLNTVSSDVQSAKDIRLYGMIRWLNTIYQKNMDALSEWYRRYTKKIFGVAVWDGVLGLLREAIAYGYLIFLVLRGDLNVAEFALYFGMITGFSVWLSSLLGQLAVLQRISLSFDRLRSYLDYPDGDQSGELIPPADRPGSYTLSHVSYRYDGAEADTLQDLTLEIPAGEHLAIVGLNGAGKTTLVKLLTGLTDPTAGELFYDGKPMRAYDRTAIYRGISAVFQQHSLLPVSIAEIVAETVAERIDRSRVESCLRQADLWGRIVELPMGMDSRYSRTIYDDGVEFSGGEIQKLLLARALYRDAPIMVLDEPTAALDPLAENRLYETYHRMMAGKTTVFVSHRLASTRFCDRILLIEDGRILESGSHEELIRRNGRYASLFEAQAKYYRENGEVEA